MDGNSIIKNQPLPAAADFAQLRELGMAYIRELSGANWTDHNLHDPGITTLEILCYAITDLAYRTSFSTQDLLTTENGFDSDPQSSSFFPAQQALTCTPLTLLDYRKLLLKIEGVRNAWLMPLTDPDQASSEVPVYVDYVKGSLSLDEQNILNQDNPHLHINGLYRVWLELEAHPDYGSLNVTALPLVLRSAHFKGLGGYLTLLDDNPDNQQAWAIDIDDELPIGVSVNLLDGRRAEIEVELDSVLLPTLLLVLDKPVSATEADWHSLFFSDIDKLLLRFADKQAITGIMLKKAACALHDNRNLCEDYRSIQTIGAEYVAVCADIEVAADADLEKVYALVIFAIEQYLNPPVNYYRLSELLEQGFTTDQIFNGPYINTKLMHAGEPVYTKPGFVKDEELIASELRAVVHSSDIINELMDIDKVKAVTSIQLRKYDALGNPIGDSDNWCLPISPGHQPVLYKKSPIRLYKQGLEFVPNQAEVDATLRHLRQAAIKLAYTGIEEALSIPVGEYRDTLSHYPVQHDFPKTYQIGVAGLKANADHRRIAQAQQFKAYLLFFEQMLADYLAQLANLSKLFSLDPDLKQSYFSQYLTDIQGATQPDNFADEFYIDKSLFADEKARNSLREDEEAFQARRNRLLDHLLARFAERFSDYVLLMHQQSGDTLKTNQQLITDKIAFLREQPVLSRERNKAFNYRPEELALVWDSPNVSGLEKRVAKLAGMQNYFRRYLSCAAFFSILFDTRKVGDEFRIEIKDQGQFILFKSKELYVTRQAAMADAAVIFPHLLENNIFTIEQTLEGDFIYQMSFAGTTLVNDEEFETEQAAVDDIKSLLVRHAEVLEEATGEEQPDDEDHPLNVLFDTREYGNDYRVEIKDPGQFILFKSKEIFPSRELALEQARVLFAVVGEQSAYQIDSSGGNGAVVYHLSHAGVTLTHDELFDTAADAQQDIDIVIHRYQQVLEFELECNDEGMYLIEHLLLRPRNQDAQLLDVCVNDPDQACGEQDPYSFRASVVLPYWPARFQQLAFRYFLEQLLREQAPAHVHLKICWIDYGQMTEFEACLRTWLQALATEDFASPVLTEAQNDLIDKLQRLKSVFPTARLHDCQDDDSGAPVYLDSTNLGSF